MRGATSCVASIASDRGRRDAHVDVALCMVGRVRLACSMFVSGALIVTFASRSCGVVRSVTSRDVARASGSGRRAARSVRDLSHTLLLLSVYGKAAGVREPCGVSSRPIRVSEHDVPGMPVRGAVYKTDPSPRTPHTHTGWPAVPADCAACR